MQLSLFVDLSYLLPIAGLINLDFGAFRPAYGVLLCFSSSSLDLSWWIFGISPASTIEFEWWLTSKFDGENLNFFFVAIPLEEIGVLLVMSDSGALNGLLALNEEGYFENWVQSDGISTPNCISDGTLESRSYMLVPIMPFSISK